MTDQATNPKDQAKTRPSLSAVSLDKLWALFASTRLALVLILVIAAASLVGVLVAQAPEGIRSDPLAYARWVGEIRPKYGFATDAMNTIGLLNVFQTWWFQTLIVLLATNILVCTLHRSGTLLSSVFAKPRVAMPEKFFDRAKLQSSITVSELPFDAVSDAVRRALKRSRYRVVAEKEADAIHVFSEKNRFVPLATLVHHAGMVTLLLGFVVGGMLGFENRAFVVPEGTERAIGTTGISLRLNSFVDEYYPSGPPKDYRSQVTLFDNGQFVREATVRVNEPLKYRGIRIHQAYFGPATILEVRDRNGNIVASQAVPLEYQTQERPLGTFAMPNQKLDVYVIGPASSFADASIPPGQIRLEAYKPGSDSPAFIENLHQGQPKTIGDLEYTFVRERQFSGFMIVNNPGEFFLWAGAIAIVLGLIWTFYFPHQQLWARWTKREDGTVLVQMGAAQGKMASFEKEFEKISNRVVKATESAGGRTTVASKVASREIK